MLCACHAAKYCRFSTNSLIPDLFGFSVMLTLISPFVRELFHDLKHAILGAWTETWGITSKIQPTHRTGGNLYLPVPPNSKQIHINISNLTICIAVPVWPDTLQVAININSWKASRSLGYFLKSTRKLHLLYFDVHRDSHNFYFRGKCLSFSFLRGAAFTLFHVPFAKEEK